MKPRLKRYVTLIANTFAFFCVSSVSLAQLSITDNQTAAQLIQRLVGNNVTVLNPVLNCPNAHNAQFSTVNTNLGLSGGIVLATGTASTLSGPYNQSVGQSVTSPGDADLAALIPPYTTNDACVLEFDFVPDIDSISTLKFDYVFGSEEYPGFTCSQYNDVFGFLLSGPGYMPAVNIALVPGTNIPVAINSINSGIPTGGPISTCNNMGPGSPFPQYFVNNNAQNGQTIALDGFTTVLQASAIVYPCDTYHMKLGIANAEDNQLQSAVFLKENSFSVDTVVLNLDGVITADSSYLVEGCTPATIIATRNATSTHKKKICLSYGGTAINGLDYPMLPDSLIIQPGSTVATLTLAPIQDNIVEPGFETVVIRRLNCCTLMPIDSVTIRIRDSLKMDIISKDTALCAGAQVTLHATGDPTFSFNWSPSAGVANPSDTLTTANPTETTTYTVTASYNTCPSVSRSFTATVEPLPIVDILTQDLNFCIGSPVRIESTVGPASFANYTYSWSPATGLSDPNIKNPSFYVNTPGDFHFTLTATTPLGCSGSDSLHIIARPAAMLTDVTADFIAKYGDVVRLNANGTLYYTWTPDALLDYPNTHNPNATALDTATFMVIGMNEYGCKDTAFVKMGIDYTIVTSIPSAFSPNNDGMNDVFRIVNMKFQRVLEFRIFNRWGQQVFETTDPKGGWDGTYKGVPQEAGVYGYIIRIATPDGKVKSFQGDVTLVR